MQRPRSQGLVHLLRHFGGSEGQMAALPEAIRWQRRLQLSPHLCPSTEKYLLCVFFQGSAVWLLPGVEKKAETQQIPVGFLCSVTATSSHCQLLDKVPGFHSHLHKSWISNGYFKRSFSNLYLERIRHSSIPQRTVF